MLLSAHVTSVLFSVQFNNLAGFYWSYTLLLKSPFLCALVQTHTPEIGLTRRRFILVFHMQITFSASLTEIFQTVKLSSWFWEGSLHFNCFLYLICLQCMNNQRSSSPSRRGKVTHYAENISASTICYLMTGLIHTTRYGYRHVAWGGGRGGGPPSHAQNPVGRSLCNCCLVPECEDAGQKKINNSGQKD